MRRPLLLLQAYRAMRRLLQRRALQGWYAHVLFLQQQRAKLIHVAQTLMFGSLARCFLAWLSFAGEQRAKQLVFAAKQRAVQEALRFGERVRKRHNTEMLTASFQAWRFKVMRREISLWL